MPVNRVPPILLLEDEADDASFVRRALQKASIKNPLSVCKTGAAAREHLTHVRSSELPVLAIVDISVPTPLMVWWAAAFTILTLFWAVRSFDRRAL